MDTIISNINAVFCSVLFALIVSAILHPGVKDGIVVKSGLIVLATGFGSLAFKFFSGLYYEEIHGLLKALLLVHVGACILFFGYFLRTSNKGHKMRRSTDWAELDELPPIQWPQVSGGADDKH